MTRLYLKVHMFVNEVFHGILHYSARWSEPAVFSKKGPVIPVPGAVRYTSSLQWVLTDPVLHRP